MRLVRTRRKFGCEINITPLIDIVFLLIIFSMVVSQFAKLQAEKLDLPEARKGVEPKPDPAPRIVVNVPADGPMVVSGRRHSPASLGRLLSAEADQRGAADLSVVVRSDRHSPWRRVREVLRMCAAAKIARVKVAVIDPESPEGAR